MSNENSELGDLKKKFIEGFKQFEKAQQLIPIINSFIENFNKLLNPMYKTAVKLRALVKRFIYTAETFTQFQEIVPQLQKMFKGKIPDFTI